MKYILFAAVLVFTGLAGAGGSRVGNGGHGVVCKDSAGRLTTLPELLDLYEASHLYGRIPQWIFVSSIEEAIESYREQIQFALPPDHPFLSLFDQIPLLKSSLSLSDEPLVPTDDIDLEHHLTLGTDCRIEQIAVRSAPPFEGHLEVSREFWMGSSYQVQALLLMHEAFHSWFWHPDEKISEAKALRQLIGVLYTSSLFSKRDQELVRALIETRQPLPEKDLSIVR